MSFRRYSLIVGIVLALISVLPAIVAHSGGNYLGHHYNTDDHMVYAAWMNQAAEGRFFFDNRFTTDDQPGLTVHLYFWLVGTFARFLGLFWAETLFRFALGVGLVVLLGRFVERLRLGETAARWVLAMTPLAGGLGFLVWHNFGQTITRPTATPVRQALMDRLPIDVWQPEVFVWPSMLTNHLFLVSLCLMLVFGLCVLAAREGHWRPIAGGALSLGVLMNIHSYDVLTLGLVGVGFLVATHRAGQLNGPWVGRVALMVLGVVPAALWFLYVLRNDPVFQARAATPTWTTNFRTVFFGLAPLILLVVGEALHRGLRPTPSETGTVEDPASDPSIGPRVVSPGLIGGWLIGGLALMLIFAAGHTEFVAWAGPVGFLALFAWALGSCWLTARPDPTYNFLSAWAWVGLVAPYFPAAFQRKLAAGLAIPWAILGGIALVALLRSQPPSTKRLVAGLASLILVASSIRWFGRNQQLLAQNVSNTTMHAAQIDPGVQAAIDFLRKQSGKTVALAPPGVWNQQKEPDSFATPLVPDWNAVLSGMGLSYGYAAHWSETPEYPRRRGLLQEIYYNPDRTPAERASAIQSTGADYMLILSPAAAQKLGAVDLSGFGPPRVQGQNYWLIQVTRSED